MNAVSDMLLVFAAISLSGLRSLQNALACDRVVYGRFVNGKGGGCVFHWLSEREMVDRPSRIRWSATNWLFGSAEDQAMRRMIVGWDANNPDAIIKGPGYDSEYPAASYVLTREALSETLNKVIAEREALAVENPAELATV